MADMTFKDDGVAEVFSRYPEEAKARLLFLRRLIMETAAATEGVGELEETLKWGEPSYLTPDTKSGSTVRIDWKERSPDEYAVYFKCTTDLVATFRERFPDTFRFSGTRAIVFRLDEEIPIGELRECIRLALTYHLRKKRRR